MAEHTPGPWRVREVAENTGRQVVGSDKTIIAAVMRSASYGEADARLIAAAPDLLAALKELIDPDVQGTINQQREARIHALIAKAEGRDDA